MVEMVGYERARVAVCVLQLQDIVQGLYQPRVCVWEMGTLAEDLDCNWVSAELCGIPNTHCPEAIRMWNLTGEKFGVWGRP